MADFARLDELQRKYAENPRRYFAPLANEYRKAGELSAAVQICRDELARFPGHMSGHVVLGQALYESRRPTEAQAAFERALALDPENLIALRHLGDIARDRGDLREARSWYERVLEADPRNDDIAAQLSRLAPTYGRPPAAPPAVSGAAPVASAPAAAAPPPAPVLEPLEWTALDLDLPGASAASADTVESPVADERIVEAPPLEPDGALLDFDPSSLAPLTTADGTPDDGASVAAPMAAPIEEPYATISDEVSALADGFGFESEPDAEAAPGPAPTEAPVAEAHVAEAPHVEPPVAAVPAELEPAAVLRWDDLLPSLDGEEEDADAPPVQSAPELVDVTDVTDVTDVVGGSEVAGIVEPAETLAAVDAADEAEEAPAEVESVEVESVAEVAPAEPEASPAIDPAHRMPDVETAREVEIADVVAVGTEAREPVAFGSDAIADDALPSFEELDLPGADSSAAVAEPVAAAAEPSVEPAVEASAGEPDLYDFLIPIEPEPQPTSAAGPAEMHEPAPEEQAAPDWEAPAAAGETIEAPAFTWLEQPAPPSEPDGVPAFDAALFAPPTPAYDPVVGLDEPPPAPVPPVLTAAASELDDEDGASPAPGGAFVTETMAELLSRQGHLEQALDVYARLEAQRPDDAALRGRADVLRAQLHGSGSHPEADVIGATATTAGAFFASLAFDEPVSADAPSPAPDASAEEPTFAAPGFFDAPGDPADEQAAARLARAVGPQEDTDALVTAIYDRPPRPAAPPLPAPAEPPADAPVGLAEFSFERFFAGLEEGVPDAESPPAPLHESASLAAPETPSSNGAAPEGDGWAERDARPPAVADARPSDPAAAPELTPAPVNEDEDLAQFNAWLKGLIGS